MKSIKKRFKLILMEICESANELDLLSADLSLLSDIQHIAKQVLSAEATLNQQISALDKKEFREGIADSEALSVLDGIIDIDAMSTLEDRFFSELNNLDTSKIGNFLQQMLEKIDKCYSRMIENIQQLSALLGNEDEQ